MDDRPAKHSPETIVFEPLGNSRAVRSSQTEIHPRLDELILRYQRTKHRRPVANHTSQAFNKVTAWLADPDVPKRLDLGCGTGQSTAIIAERHPEAKVIGLDRSQARLNRHQSTGTNNYRLVRAEAQDFLRLAREHKWCLAKVYLLYPNPYPKPTQVQRRWHASPAMADLMSITTEIEVRSNWRLYCEEFAHACARYGWRTDLTPVGPNPHLTAFEKKYTESNQTCWRLQSWGQRLAL